MSKHPRNRPLRCKIVVNESQESLTEKRLPLPLLVAAVPIFRVTSRCDKSFPKCKQEIQSSDLHSFLLPRSRCCIIWHRKRGSEQQYCSFASLNSLRYDFFQSHMQLRLADFNQQWSTEKINKWTEIYCLFLVALLDMLRRFGCHWSLTSICSSMAISWTNEFT